MFFDITLPGTNIAPEKDEIPFGDDLFSGTILVSGSVFNLKVKIILYEYISWELTTISPPSWHF